MSKAVYAGLFAVGLALLALAAGCGTTEKDGGCGCSACGCDGCGDGCGCAGCGKGCGDGGCGGCGGCCGCGGDKASADDAKRAMTLFRQYKKWSKVNAKPFLSKDHGRHMIVDFANATAAKIFRAGKGNYKPGAVVAKQGWKKGKLKMVWLMEKRGAGYDKDNGDWWYATLSTKGKVMNSGRVASCITCHDRADNDYVFGLPPKK